MNKFWTLLADIAVAESIVFSAESPKLGDVFPVGDNVDRKIAEAGGAIDAEGGGWIPIPLAFNPGDRFEIAAQRSLDNILPIVRLDGGKRYSIGFGARFDLGDVPFEYPPSHASYSSPYFSPVKENGRWVVPEEYRQVTLVYAGDFWYRAQGATEVRLYVRQGSKEEWFSSKTLGGPCELGTTEDLLKYGIIRIRAEFALPKEGREVSVMILQDSLQESRWVFYGPNGILQDYSSPPPDFLARSGPSLRPPTVSTDGTMTLTVMGSGDRPVRIESTGDLRAWREEEVSAIRQGKSSVPSGAPYTLPYSGGNRFFRVTLAEQTPQGN